MRVSCHSQGLPKNVNTTTALNAAKLSHKVKPNAPVIAMQLNSQEAIDHYYMTSGKIGFVNVASVGCHLKKLL